MEIGERVQIKEAVRKGKWAWLKAHGTVTGVDRHCLTVWTSEGEQIRDVREHFRKVDRFGQVLS